VIWQAKRNNMKLDEGVVGNLLCRYVGSMAVVDVS
jgi:hypothetical protein